MPFINIYDAANVDEISWPNTEGADLAKRYLLPLVKEGTLHYIDNIDAKVCLLAVDQHVLPLVIVNENYENSYVCSPYGHYILLALESMTLIKNRYFRKSAEKIVKGLGKVLKIGKINKIIYVNNWLFSTDLYPDDITQEQIAAITAFIRKKFPQHAIAFRSINAVTNKLLKDNLKNCSFKSIVSRQVYLTDTKNQSIFKTRIVKSDLKLWRENDYKVIDKNDMSLEDSERILELYKILCLEHHSKLNPQVNSAFIKLMMDRQLLEFKALKKNGTIEGIVGFIERNQIFHCPFIGFDKSQKDQTKLYRLLSTMLLLEANKKSGILHQSAGASFYKTIRRAEGCLEYMAVHTDHLPLKQKFAWSLLKIMMNTAAAPFMKKY